MSRDPTPPDSPGEHRRAVIVGAGIAGLAAAHALGDLGCEVRVLERDHALRSEGAGLTLWPNATRALHSLGLERTVAATGHVLPDAMTLTPTGGVLTRMPLDQIERRFGKLLSVHRGEFLSALAEGLEGIIQFGKAAILEDGRLRVDGAPLAADLVVGADGIGSVTRRLVAGDVDPRPAGYSAWRGVAASGARTPRGASETLGRGKRFGLVPLSNERTYWYAVIAGAGDHADVSTEFGGWHEPIADVLAATPRADRSFLAIADLPRLKRWHLERTVLVGDSAHAMTPNLGQGAAPALEDVAALARRLRSEPIDAALAGYAAERKRHGERMVARSRAMGRFAQASNPLAVRLRDAVARRTPDALLLRQLATS